MKRLFLLILSAIMIISSSCIVFAADEWAKAEPAGSRAGADIDDYITVNNEALDRLLSNYQTCNLHYASIATLTVSIGEVVCSNSGGTLRRFRANTSATTVTWANIDVGSEAGATYYVHAIADTDATTFTCVISTSSTAPTGVTYFKQIGSFYNNSDGDIEQVSDGIKMKLAISTGEIADDAIIPLPTGFTESECYWIVSPRIAWDESANSNYQGFYSRCYADSSRVVTVEYFEEGSHDGTANYLIIGYRDNT